LCVSFLSCDFSLGWTGKKEGVGVAHLPLASFFFPF
jgi:hypothetical protein